MAQVTGTAVTGQRLPMGVTITIVTISIWQFSWTPAVQHTGSYKICVVGSTGGKAVMTLNPPAHTAATADLVASTAGQLDTGDTLTASASVSGATFHSSATYAFYSCNFSTAQTLTLRPGDGQLIGADGNIITTGTAAGQCATGEGNVSGTSSSRTYTIAASDATNQRFIYYTVRQTADTASNRPAIAGVSSGIQTNRAPTVGTAVADFELATGEMASYPLTFSDPDGDSLDYTLTTPIATGEATLTHDAATGMVSVTGVRRGEVTVRITADDGRGGSVTEEFVVTITNADPMAGDRPSNLRFTLGGADETLTATQTVAFSDADMDALTCSATSDADSIVRVDRFEASVENDACLVTVTALQPGRASISVTARDATDGSTTATSEFTVTVNAPPAPPAASSSSSGGIVALAIIGAGAYYYWKKRQIASGNAAKMALLPEVSFDLDRSDNRAFYTKMNWQKSGNSNWQLRGNAKIHTKYSGKLLDWNADSHIGYRLNGKFGDFNPYLRGKFVQNDPENAEMRKTYSFGLNYSLPKRFSVQIVQPDSEISRFSVKTQWHLPRGIGLQLNQPNSDLKNYGFGVSWQKSKIRYGLSGETGSNSYRLSGEFWF